MSYDEEMIKIRQKLLDAQKVGLINGDTSGVYQQTILQIHQEAERRKQSCLQQAETLLRQSQAAQAQGAAFGMIGSILYNIIDNFVIAQSRAIEEEKRLAEEKLEKEALLKTIQKEEEDVLETLDTKYKSTIPPTEKKKNK